MATASLNTALAAESTDPDHGPNNTMWRLATFPTQGTSNKTSGAEFRVSTVGRQNIAMSWDHYNSATCSRYWRVQYSLDGTTFTDFMGYVNTNVTTWFSTNTSFAAIAGANNNPNFVVRLVSELEGTALGTSSTNYVGVQTTGGYSTGGTLWLDMITFTGDPYVAPPPPVPLAITPSGNVVQISWSTSAAPATLQSTLSLSPVNWQNYPQLPVVAGDRNVVGITNATGTRFFRLAR